MYLCGITPKRAGTLDLGSCESQDRALNPLKDLSVSHPKRATHQSDPGQYEVIRLGPCAISGHEHGGTQDAQALRRTH